MKSRRAGHGCSSGYVPEPGIAALTTQQPCSIHHRHTLGDDPAARAALERARLDIRAYEQTEAYWNLTWLEERLP